MLGDTLPITHKTVAKTLSKVNQDNYGAVYFLDDGVNRFTATVKHTIPARGKSGESHHLRLDVEYYDATTGELTHVATSWTNIRTDVGIQDQDDSEGVANALIAVLNPTLIGQLVARQS